jgi:hypothetical protein
MLPVPEVEYSAKPLYWMTNERKGAVPTTSVLISPLAQEIVAAEVLPPVAAFETVMVLDVKLVIVVPAGKLVPERNGAPIFANDVLATLVITLDPEVTIPELNVTPTISLAKADITPAPTVELMGEEELVVDPPKPIQPFVFASNVV